MYFYCYDYVFLLYVYVWPPWLRFFRAFSSVVRQMPGYNPQRRGTARNLPSCCLVLCIFLCCSMYFFVLFYVFLCCSILFVLWRSLYCLCVYVYCTTATGWLPKLQLTYIVSYHSISYSITLICFPYNVHTKSVASATSRCKTVVRPA